MNISRQSKLSILSFAMLALFSMALFVVPTQEVDAQAATTTSACFNPNTNKLSVVPSTGLCVSPDYKVTANNKALGFCLLKEGSVNVAKSPYLKPDGSGPMLSADGKNCLGEDSKSVYGTFVPFPKSITTPPINTNTNTGTNTNSGGTGGPGGGSSGTTTQGDCEEKFHKVGPLCVPNNPFDDDSIAGGNASATELATRVIRIMLYFASIVAVMMAIVGGYRVMTAQGNETQAAGGRKTLANALIGLGITILAYLIVQVVLNFLTK